MYFGARYYNPQIGRWLNQDPLGMINGPNLYAYCNNNPTNLIDPWGLQTDGGNTSGGNTPGKCPKDQTVDEDPLQRAWNRYGNNQYDPSQCNWIVKPVDNPLTRWWRGNIPTRWAVYKNGTNTIQVDPFLLQQSDFFIASMMVHEMAHYNYFMNTGDFLNVGESEIQAQQAENDFLQGLVPGWNG